MGKHNQIDNVVINKRQNSRVVDVAGHYMVITKVRESWENV
jgi:hypothetical protein